MRGTLLPFCGHTAPPNRRRSDRNSVVYVPGDGHRCGIEVTANPSQMVLLLLVLWLLLTELDLVLKLRFIRRRCPAITCPTGCRRSVWWVDEWASSMGGGSRRMSNVHSPRSSRRMLPLFSTFQTECWHSRMGPKKTSKNINLALIKKYFYSEWSVRPSVLASASVPGR